MNDLHYTALYQTDKQRLKNSYNVTTVGWERRAKCTNKATSPTYLSLTILYISARFEQTSISSNPNLTPQCFLINILSTPISANCYIENLNNA